MLSTEQTIISSNQDVSYVAPVRRHHHRHNVKSRYEFLKTLGKGTYGKVKLARHRETNKLVAVKAIKKDKIKDSNDLKHIRREMEIMSAIQHQHIIQIYEVFENQDKIVIVMEYAAGGELYDYLAEKRGISEEDAKSFFRQIVSAVQYCHEHGIVHRDLKLENILLDENNKIKIADFGLANSFKADSLLDTFCGSPLYASPEIVCGVKYKGPEVDSWSLGVLLYALVYGTMPFDGRNYQVLTKQITSGFINQPQVLSEAHDLICWMLTVDPKLRATVKDIADHSWVKCAVAPEASSPTFTQDALNYVHYLAGRVNENATDDLNSTLKAGITEETSRTNQPKGILKRNSVLTEEVTIVPAQTTQTNVEKTLEGKLAAACGLHAKDSLKLKTKPKSASGKRRVLRSRRDRESGYYSSPERAPAATDKPYSSDPTLHPNIPGSVPQIKSSLVTAERISRLRTKQSSSLPLKPPTVTDERLNSVSSDDASSAGGSTRPASTYSDSSILSTDSFDLCTFDASVVQHPPVTHVKPQRPHSLSFVPDAPPQFTSSSAQEQPPGALTPKSEQLVRDLQRILAPSGRRTQSHQRRTNNRTSVVKRPQSLDETSQLARMMTQLNIDLDRAYKKASVDISTNLKSAEV